MTPIGASIMVQASRTSGVLTASAIVNRGQCKLMSIHACETAGSLAQIKIFDGTDATGVEIARLILAAGQTIEFDMHGVIAKNGLYFEETSGAVACSVEFQ
tara:strand:+ start:128 stop:430 length:303 start_codon:yes stop_codon:yes gene_type:complete